jgi:hypothetical protein
MNKGTIKLVKQRDIKLIAKEVEKLGLYKALRSNDTITRRAAITILL